ncbi:glutamate racemase [Flavobacteriaceae bacterium S356]|uniref:Glutamate racemase n=1 Tax=Asprobacillus argus TaxID=3076534 RepID=A0ABU3LAX5_9FLAO|nr:glutamate racemase [Flavobacteriaceae bacterium S356]
MNNSANPPIGVFDSGIGGTSILKEINNLMPYEDTIYLSDSANAPYGQRSSEEIIALSIKNTEYLLQKGCKIIVVACNTATTNAIEVLRNNYNVPFIGIEPAIKPAALKTATNVIGILATKGTLNSQLFEQTSNTINNSITIVEQVGEGLVELIERGKIYSEKMTLLLKKYLQNILNKNADCIVLGCTHYPYLIPQIRNIVGNDIHIIDSGEAVAKQTKRILSENNLLNEEITHKGVQSILINSDSRPLQAILGYRQGYTICEVAF